MADCSGFQYKELFIKIIISQLHRGDGGWCGLEGKWRWGSRDWSVRRTHPQRKRFPKTVSNVFIPPSENGLVVDENGYENDLEL